MTWLCSVITTSLLAVMILWLAPSWAYMIKQYSLACSIPRTRKISWVATQTRPSVLLSAEAALLPVLPKPVRSNKFMRGFSEM